MNATLSKSLLLLGVLSAATLTGCSASTDETESSDSDLKGGAVDRATVDLRFERDPHQTPAATIRNGNDVMIVLDEGRLANCGEGTTIEVWYRTKAGAAAQHKAMGNPQCLNVNRPCPFPLHQLDTTIGPAARGDLEVWFHATNPSGCEQWDSKNGANYHFNVIRGEREVLSFPKSAAPSQSGPLLADSTVGFDYVQDRMHLCDFRGQEGDRSFELFYQFDDARPTKVSSGNLVFGNHLPELVIPHQAHTLTMWFHSPGGEGCAESWDSNFGHNYVFPIAH